MIESDVTPLSLSLHLIPLRILLSIPFAQVPTPQRLSQLPTSSPAQSSHQNSQPLEPQPSTSKRDLLSSFTSRMQKATSIQSYSQEESSQSTSEPSQGEGLRWLDEDPLASKTDVAIPAADGVESDEEEALEKVDIDPLVFSREEFDAGIVNSFLYTHVTACSDLSAFCSSSPGWSSHGGFCSGCIQCTVTRHSLKA